MNKYRFVTRLLPEQVEELRGWLTRKNLNERTKIRLRSILRSHDQYTMDEIAELEGVKRDTVSLWITQWETYGIEGLFDNGSDNFSVHQLRRGKRLIQSDFIKLNWAAGLN